MIHNFFNKLSRLFRVMFYFIYLGMIFLMKFFNGLLFRKLGRVLWVLIRIIFSVLYFGAILFLALFYFKKNMMIFLLFVLAAFLCLVFIPLRLIVLHPVLTILYGVKDLILYIIHHGYNLLDGGKLNAYIAEFGGGKTLSIVHDVYRLHRRYHNKTVWDRGRKAYVIQKIHVVSNVEFTGIPFEPLVSLSQVVACAQHNSDIDKKQGTRTVTLVVIDEASALLNSRNFKSNIDPIFLNSLLTCRHYHLSIFYSTQKFNLTDKLLRDVTQRVISCKKYWRLMVHDIFNADDIEYASNPTLVKPLSRTGFFVLDSDYSGYDTLAVVSDLKRRVDVHDMMSEAEILALRGNMDSDNDQVSKPSWKLRRQRKR